MKIFLENKEIYLEICNSFFSRLVGNMFRKNIKSLIFPNCNSIHTFFMKKKIDVLFLNKDYKILYIYKSLSPWKVIFPKKNVYCVIELKEKSIKTLKVGDKIKTAKI